MKTNLKLLLFFFILFLVSGTYLYFAHTEMDWIPGILFSILFSFFFLSGCGSIIQAFFEYAEVINSVSGKIRLFGFPDLGAWRWEEHTDHEKADEYIQSTVFERSSLKNIYSLGDYVDAFINNTSGKMREDLRHSDAQNAAELFLDERYVPVGADICAIGKYSAEHKGLVQDHGRGLRIVPGDSEEVSESLKTWSWTRIILGLIMILLSCAFLLPMIGGEPDEIRDIARYEYFPSGYKVAQY